VRFICGIPQNMYLLYLPSSPISKTNYQLSLPAASNTGLHNYFWQENLIHQHQRYIFVGNFFLRFFLQYICQCINLKGSLTKICYAFIGTVGKLKIFDTFFTVSIFKNIVVFMSNFRLKDGQRQFFIQSQMS
jgi:hypothetical protein